MKHKNTIFSHLLIVLIIGLSSVVYGHEFDLSTHQIAKEIVVIKGTGVARENKKALLILPGFSDRKKSRKKLSELFSEQDYDLFIPDYCDRSSFLASVQNLNYFISRENLYDYKELIIVAYNVGASIMTAVINNSGTKNIKSVVIFYNPVQVYIHQFQELKHPRLNRFFNGNVVEDYNDSLYQSFDNNAVNVGFVIAQETTWMQRRLKEGSMEFDTYFWESMDLQQKFDDLVYVDQNARNIALSGKVHTEMVLHFIEKGSFNMSDRRVPYRSVTTNPEK